MFNFVTIINSIIDWIIYGRRIEFVGLIILSLYTYFTYRLWKGSKRQTHQLISPFVIFNIEREANTKHKFIIENIGEGVAFNVVLDDFVVHLLDSPKAILKLVFNKINILKSGEKKELSYTEYKDGNKVDFSLLRAYLNPAYQSEKNFIFILTYHNIGGNKYFTKFQVGKDGIKLFRRGMGRHSFWKKWWFGIEGYIRFYKDFIKTKKELKKKK